MNFSVVSTPARKGTPCLKEQLGTSVQLLSMETQEPQHQAQSSLPLSPASSLEVESWSPQSWLPAELSTDLSMELRQEGEEKTPEKS